MSGNKLIRSMKRSEGTCDAFIKDSTYEMYLRFSVSRRVAEEKSNKGKKI